MSWRRLGHVYVPSGSKPWARSHAALPLAVGLGGDSYRVFFSARDAENRSSVGWVDVSLTQKMKVISEGKVPLLTFGSPGHFDDSGVSLGSIVRARGQDLLYYLGWNLGIVAPWRNSIGVAAGNIDTPEFRRLFTGPIMDRSPDDPFSLSYPWVLRLSDTDWRMWYGSNLAGGSSPAEMQYAIKVALSTDGLNWTRSPEPVVGFSYPGEHALARPCVLVGNGGFHMWFATRGVKFRIGAASSTDGRSWTRCDEQAGLQPEGTDWEAEMVCYPCVFRHHGQMYMLYNGNSYGKSGFGLAIWQGSLL